MLDLVSPAQTSDLDLSAWSSAEVLDTPLAEDHTLRAIVLRLGAHKWQWSISSMDSDERGELISAGTERTADAARRQAASEITKCLESPLA
jgi:hypothetical protein